VQKIGSPNGIAKDSKTTKPRLLAEKRQRLSGSEPPAAAPFAGELIYERKRQIGELLRELHELPQYRHEAYAALALERCRRWWP
jgi:hypothetical protein